MILKSLPLIRPPMCPCFHLRLSFARLLAFPRDDLKRTLMLPACVLFLVPPEKPLGITDE